MTFETYKVYLDRIKNKMYKTLCLYEEESDTFDKYFHSFIYVELSGMKYWIADFPHDVWYAETLSRLHSLADRYEGDFTETEIFKTELFGIMKLIQKQIDTIGE